jgi:hypothetical protein
MVPRREDGLRAWTATYQWPGKRAFRFGTAWVRLDGTMQEVEEAVRAEFVRMWGEILPDGVPLPELKGLEPGMVMFVPEGER